MRRSTLDRHIADRTASSDGLAGDVRQLTTQQVKWHMRIYGDAALPVCLLLHGTGASSHSMDGLARQLGGQFHVLVPDLPGHAESVLTRQGSMKRQGMSSAIGELLDALSLKPVCVLGHSAGAVIAIDCVAEKWVAPHRLFALNGALRPIKGSVVFAPLARFLATAPGCSDVLAMTASLPFVSNNLLHSTGTPINPASLQRYRQLLETPAHVKNVMSMMANWTITDIHCRIAALGCPATYIACEDDPMVPCSDSRNAAARHESARLILLGQGGHLVHEIDPEMIATIVVNEMVGTENHART